MGLDREIIVDIKSSDYDPGVDYVPAGGLKVAFKLHDKRVINNIGFVCYLKRELINHSRGEYSVDPSSLDKTRYKLANELLHDLAAVGNSSATIQADFDVYQLVINWFDNNGFSGFHRDIEVAKKAYQAYTDELVHQIKNSKIVLRTAGKKQRYARQLLALAYGHEKTVSVTYGVRFISESSGEPVEALDEKVVKAHVAILVKIFTTHGDAILQQTPLPYLFECDEFKSYVNASFNSQHIKTPYDEHMHQLKNFNFEEGRILTFEEYKKVSTAKNVSARDLENSQRTIDDANGNPRHKVRLSYCTLAMQAYLHLFIAATGANGQPLRDLEVPELNDINKDTISKELREFKLRANGRVVSYKITRKALSYLKKYLELRKWHLNGREFKYLFYSVDGLDYETPKKLIDGFTYKFYKRIKGRYLPKDTEAIGTQKYRRFRKDVHEALGIDPMVTAEIMGHSIGVSEKAYSGGSRARQKRELTKYWENIGSVIKISSQQLEPTPIAGCGNVDQPVPIHGDIPTKPNCNISQTCLYCAHFAMHSDETDLRKIMSAKYFMEVVLEDFPDLEHVEQEYRPLIERINELVLEVRDVSSAHSLLVDSVYESIFSKHEINPFWQLKLDRFERLGVIAL